jgi:hypothetical protein
MGGNSTVILIVAGIFLVVAIVATIVWWSLADRIYPGASESTGQYIGKDTHRRGDLLGESPIIIVDAGAAEPHHGPDHATHHDASSHAHSSGIDAGGTHDSGASGHDAGGFSADGGGGHH